MSESTLLTISNLKMHFPVTQGLLKRQVGSVNAVDNISLEIRQGEILGLVGESGCGKSTLGRCILQLLKPTSGQVFYRDTELTALKKQEMRPMRRHLQMICQDPYSSLDPRQQVRSIVGEGLVVHSLASGADYRDRVDQLLELVGLDPSMGNRYPHEFSGGQRQRIGIARALALDPEFIVCDEPVSALDVSIQAQILNLLQELREQLGLTYLFIGHDLAVVRAFSDRVAVMYLGKLVEVTSSQQLYSRPMHPYTQALLSAVPIPDPAVDKARARIMLSGDVPSPLSPPTGCHFRTRCRMAAEECAALEPELRELEPGHFVACLRAEKEV